MASMQSQLDDLNNLVTIIAGVLGGVIGVTLILLIVLFVYVKHVEEKFKNMALPKQDSSWQSGSQFGDQGFSRPSQPQKPFLPRIDSPMKPFGHDSHFGSDGLMRNEQPQSFPGRSNAAPIRNPFNRQEQSWQNGSQPGGQGFGRPGQHHRPGGPGPQRPAMMGF